ncbi:MAG: 50S ribosomal protein L11 methyltransferase [Cyanobacteriota bacterium]|jgi:ribosomal protein L11 methyltransferase
MASSTGPRGWWKLSLASPGDLEESLLWKLPQLGVHRVAVLHGPSTPMERELVAWLPQSEWSEANLLELERALRPLGEPFALALPAPRWEAVEDEDWSSSWKQHWGPDPVGQHWLVLPAWLEEPPEAQGRWVIRLDPGPAFGTGSHPTTRLCLEALEALGEARVREGAPAMSPLAGLRVADLGCGSGVLGLAALAQGANAVYAVDIDPLAIRATLENAALNGWTSLHTALGSAEELGSLLGGRPADLLLCNILAPVIADLSEEFSRLLAPRGLGLLSGLLVSQAEGLIAALAERGWQASLTAVQEPWGLLTMGRGAFVS